MIRFTTAGGVAGHEVTTLINPKMLPLGKLEVIKEKLDAAKFFDIQETEFVASPSQPDSIRYEVKVDGEGFPSHMVKIDDTALFSPGVSVDTRDKLLSLIDALQELVTEQRRKLQS